MTRFLNLVILFLHFFSDVRRKVTLLATAALLAAMATLIVAGTVVVGLAARHTTQNVTKVAQPEPHESTLPLSLAKRRSASLPASSKPAIDNAVPPSTVSITPDPTSVTQPPSPQNDNVNDSIATPSQIPSSKPPGATVQLSQIQTMCNQGRAAISVASAQVLLQKSLIVDTALTWYWETRIDSGDTTAHLPVASTQNSQSVIVGQAAITLTATDSSQPLLIAPEVVVYAYSFRLHILAPFEVTSDWTSVPQGAASCAA